MAFEIITYRISFKNVEGTTYDIDITDTDTIIEGFGGGQPVQIIPLTQGGTPLVMSTINNSDDIYQTIFGTKATMTFKRTDEVGMSTFSSGEDNRFSVWIGVIGFRGFLVMDDNSEVYLPPGQDVTLVATDNLGLLRNIELSDSNGAKLRGPHTIIKYVYECLLKAGPIYNGVMQINVMNNLYEDSHANRGTNMKNCAWEQTFLDALTYEKGINEFDDCYTVLHKIFSSWGMSCFWYMGVWWIVRRDEYKESNNLSSSTMLYTRYIDGIAIDGFETIFEKTIDTDRSPLSPAARHVYGEPPLVFMQRPHKSDKFEFKYETPEEVIKNINFERGALNAPLSGVGYSAFDVDDWTIRRDFPPYTTPNVFNAFIKRIFDANGYEQERYLVLTEPTSDGIDYLESSPIEVCFGGKLNFSFDYRWDADIGGVAGPSLAFAYVRLEGDDGTHWTLDDDGKWYQSNASWTTFIKALESAWIYDNVDETEWRTISVEAQPMPRTGKMYVMFRVTAINNVNTEFSNISISYFHLIDGIYAPYKGESYKVSTTDDYSAKREEQLWLADAPCKAYKGSLLTFDGSAYNLTSSWLDYKLANASPSPVVTEPNRFAWWQIRAMWNQFRLGKRLFQGNWKGLDSGTSEPLWLLHRIKITSVSEHNLIRKFIFLSLEQDHYRCTYSGVLCEIDNTSDPRSFEETLDFKYLMS